MRPSKHFAALPITAAVVALSIGGCFPGFDRHLTELEPTTTGYLFKAPGRGAYPIDDARAERQRLAWLDQEIAEKHGCPSGYDIVSRKPVNHPVGNGTSGIDIFYEVKCKA